MTDNLKNQQAVKMSRTFRKTIEKIEDRIEIMNERIYTECDHVAEYYKQRVKQLEFYRNRAIEIKKEIQQEIYTG